jgi:hypothetical protein
MSGLCILQDRKSLVQFDIVSLRRAIGCDRAGGQARGDTGRSRFAVDATDVRPAGLVSGIGARLARRIVS